MRAILHGAVVLGATAWAACITVVAPPPATAPPPPRQPVFVPHASRCAQGDAADCVRAGLASAVGQGVPRDEALAMRLFERACRLGGEAGCLRWAQLAEWGRGSPPDLPLAQSLYEARCRAGSGEACAGQRRLQRLSTLLSGPCPVPNATSAPDAGEAGGLPKAVIGAVIEQHREEVQYCYDRSLQVAPDKEGQLTVSFVIGPDGAVLRYEFEKNSLQVPDVQQCLREQIARWRFPCPVGGGEVAVTYPWVFKVSAGPAGQRPGTPW
ncbi:MAG: AgmX/PglI C-terminal domain-containing protein [Myxococcaceae bacterium]|nr:AgmX/PglI C-terminal domain-containing protein [Myxococcaceae bacterium]